MQTELLDSSVPSETLAPVCLILFDGETSYTVTKAFYDAIRYQVEDILPALIRSAKYTLKELCGDAFWQQLGAGEQRMAGRCMADMVCRELLPVLFTEGKHEYPLYYRLK